jgi:hypothetical protein
MDMLIPLARNRDSHVLYPGSWASSNLDPRLRGSLVRLAPSAAQRLVQMCFENANLARRDVVFVQVNRDPVNLIRASSVVAET